MAFPEGVTTSVVQCGPYYDASGRVLTGLVASVVASGQIIHVPTGAVILPRSQTLRVGRDGRGAIELVHANLPGISPAGFTYSFKWRAEGGTDKPADKTVLLLSSYGSPVNYDKLMPIAPFPGVVVPPNLWQQGPGYVHQQDTPQSVWTVHHSLTRRAVAVNVYSLDFQVQWDNVPVQIVDENTVRLTFDDPTSGIAFVM